MRCSWAALLLVASLLPIVPAAPPKPSESDNDDGDDKGSPPAGTPQGGSPTGSNPPSGPSVPTGGTPTGPGPVPPTGGTPPEPVPLPPSGGTPPSIPSGGTPSSPQSPPGGSPPTGHGPSVPPTGGTPSTPPSGGTPPVEGGPSAPPTGPGPSVPPAGGTPSTPPSGGIPPIGGSPSAPPTGPGPSVPPAGGTPPGTPPSSTPPGGTPSIPSMPPTGGIPPSGPPTGGTPPSVPGTPSIPPLPPTGGSPSTPTGGKPNTPGQLPSLPPPPPIGTAPPRGPPGGPPQPPPVPQGVCINPCLLSSGGYGECNGDTCEALCQDTPGWGCGSHAGTDACQSDSTVIAHCCQACKALVNAKQCLNTANGDPCSSGGSAGICQNMRCVATVTTCKGLPCTAPACHKAVCASACTVLQLADGTACGGGRLCKQGSCSEGTGGVGAVCSTSDSCQVSASTCNVNICNNQRCKLAAVANGTTCGLSTKDGFCWDGVCVGSSQGCVGVLDNTACPIGICKGGYCQEQECIEGSPCGANRDKVCKVGTCTTPVACSAEDHCRGCNAVQSLNQSTWNILVVPCWLDSHTRLCKGTTGLCRTQRPTSTLPPTDKPYGGPNSAYGTQPPSQNAIGVKWKIQRADLSSTLENASRCIDGNIATTCRSLASWQATWFQLDLGVPLQVGMVRLHNVGGWCAQKLVCGYECGNLTCAENPGFMMRVGNTGCTPGEPCTGNRVCSVLKQNTGEFEVVDIWCRSTSAVQVETAHVLQSTNNTVVGRYVQIGLVEADHMRQVHIADVEVFAPQEMSYDKAMQLYPNNVGQTDSPSYDGVESKSFKPPSQATTNANSIVVGACLVGSLFIVACVGFVLRAREVEQWWLRTLMVGTGVLRVYDWVSDLMFWLYVSAIPDLGEVNSYSIAVLVVMAVNSMVEFSRVGWAAYGTFKGEPFFWVGSQVVLLLQIPAVLRVDISYLSSLTYHSRMRDRWDWLTHLTEDVPQIVIATVYIIMRELNVTSVMTLSISVMALVGSAVLKLRRKFMRHGYHKERKLQIEAGSSKQPNIYPNPKGLPELNFMPPQGRQGMPTKSLEYVNPLPPRDVKSASSYTDYDYSYSYDEDEPSDYESKPRVGGKRDPSMVTAV